MENNLARTDFQSQWLPNNMTSELQIICRSTVVQSKSSRDYSVATKVELVEILYFKHFYEHFTFGETDWSKRGKRLEKYVRVAIAIELVTVGTKLEDL